MADIDIKKVLALADEILTQARASIIMRMRFLDMALFRLKQTPENVSLATDGERMYYNPGILLKHFRDEAELVTRDYMHVLMHCIFRHMFTHKAMDVEKWDLACDIAVESIIDDLNLPELNNRRGSIHKKALDLLRLKVKPFTAEKLYRYFTDHPEEMPDRGMFAADDHEIWHNDELRASMAASAQRRENSAADQADGRGYTQTDAEAESGWKEISERIQVDLDTFSKLRGVNAGSFVQALGQLNRERYDYTAFLKQFAVMGEQMKVNDDEFDYIYYTYGLRLYDKMPLIEPLEYKDVKRIREFVIAIDTSGSTSGALVQKFLNKTYNILMSTESFFSRVNIHIIQCDADIQQDFKVTSREEFEHYVKQLKILGGGGTDFRPVFRRVAEHIKNRDFTRLKGLIYFTDGVGAFPQEMPPYKTAFVFVQNDYNSLSVPPWAMKLILEEEEINEY